VEVDSDEEEEEEEEEPDEMDVDENEDEEEEEEDEDAEGEEDDEMDAEGEEDDEMEDAPPAPRITVSKPAHDEIRVQPRKNAAPAPDVSTVEAKEISMLDDDDDEELSELESEDEEEDEDEEEGGEEDAEGEEEEESPAQANDEDEEMDSDDESRDSMSRSNTPDLSKLTRRQRALVEETRDEGLMALSNEAQKKKHLTAEEHAMRRLEMARRRKNLSEKRNEEEKMDTINRLLKKQPPKRGRRAMVELTESGQEEEPEFEKPPALYVRYTQTTSGTRMAVPEEWLSSPVGSIFASAAPASGRPYGGRMVEEVA
jgi:Ino eighty subunit 2